ncbi:MAG: hypothetical protein ABEJ22_01490 [Haloferacaceae archaeon]
MSLRKQWRSLDRATIGSAPERYGVYELGDAEGNVVDAGAGFLPDELREAFAYGEATSVRWTAANSEEHAERLLEDL